MIGILTNELNQEGARYQLLHTADTDVLLFPKNMFWAENVSENANKGDLCISYIIGNDYNYTTIGTWSNAKGIYTIQFNGIGIFSFVETSEIGVTIQVSSISNQIEILVFKTIAGMPYLGPEILKNELYKLIPPHI